MAYEKVGSWAFIIGVIIAIIAGLTGITDTWIAAFLVIIGLIVGFINIAAKESMNYLVASIALLVTNAATKWNALGLVGNYISAILGNIAVFVAPAAVIVALKAVYELAYKKK
jgi:hypothetical protein